MKTRTSFLVAIFSLLVLAYGAGPIHGQQATGQIVGTITDPSGAVLSDARVTVTNLATKATRETTTNGEGYFQILALPIGTYQVTAERQGFRKSVSDNNVLQINQALRLDFKLEIGAQTEVVEVAAQATTVETVNPTLGQSVTSRPIVNLPLNGRNVLDLAKLQPGVMESNPDDGGGGSSGAFASGAINIAGGRSDSVTYLLDGGINNNLLSNRVVFNPNPDTVAEFRLLTSNYTAEYGRNGGGVISVVTKSGTNQFHGSAFEYVRNDAFNANTFFNKRNGLPREVLKRNQFGGTIGGPVILPRFGEGGPSTYKGTDRAFFFFGYQGGRQVQTVTTSQIQTFTPAELRGDFSQSNGGSPDPNVAAFLQDHPFFQPNAALAARGILDPTRINSVAQNYIKNGLIPTSATGQLISQGGARSNSDEYTVKFDLNVRKSDRFSVTLGKSNAPTLRPFGGANVAGYADTSKDLNSFANVSYTTVFSPKLLNEFHFTTQRANRTQFVPNSSKPAASQLGIGVTPDNPTGPTRLDFASGLSIGFSPNGPTKLINNTFGYNDTLSWIAGKHNLKFGAYLSAYQNNTVYDFYVNGNYFFYGPDTGVGSGNDFADFLMGAPDEYLQFGEAPSDIRTKSYHFFGQDEWHVRSNLTLTFGLRYEYDTPKIDTRGRSFSLLKGTKSTVFPNAPKGLLFPGDAAAPAGANFPDKNNFAPRFGFAWSPNFLGQGKTSIRGGFGVFYDILKGEDNLQFNGQAPFFGFSDLFFDPIDGGIAKETNYYSAPYIAVGINNPFPSKKPAKNIDFDANGFLPFGGGGVYFVDPRLRTPYTYQYNLSIQRELARDLVFEASYVGSSSHKLTALADANPFILGTTHRLLNAQTGESDTSFSYLLEFRNLGNAAYNSGQFSLQKRVSDTKFFGTSYFQLSYTLAHSIDTASGFRNRNSQVPAYNSGRLRASSDFDTRNRLVFSGGWDLPFSKWAPKLPKRLVDGWSLYPIVSYRTGFPIDVFAGFNTRRTSPGVSGAGDASLIRANVVNGQVVLYDPHAAQKINGNAGNYYFNPGSLTNCLKDPTASNACAASIAAFGFPNVDQVVANAALRTYGSLPRNALRGPNRGSVDFAIAKTTSLYEGVKFEFRAEAFNLFNAVLFSNPDANINSPTFGQVLGTAPPRILQLGARITF